MTPDEQRLIEDLFDRLGAQGRIAKDRDADSLIRQLTSRNPDSVYMLVQSAIVYQHQLAASEERIRDLEGQVGAAEEPTSFLGGLLGGGSRSRPSERMADAPRAPMQSATSPWGAQAPQSVPRTGGGGGFLSSALSTAAGVAGGMMVADSLRSMFGGGPAHAGGFGGDSAQLSADRAQLADADRTQDDLQDQLDAQDQQDDADADYGGDDGIDV